MEPRDLVRIKPLKWEYEEYGNIGSQYNAEALIYSFTVWEVGEGWEADIWTAEYDASRHTKTFTGLATADEAKAMCQEHYENMIYELLEVSDE